MLMPADALVALGALFQWVRTNSHRASAGEFRRRALEQHRDHVPFDKAIWADAVIADGLSLRSAELLNVDESERADVELAASADPRLPHVLQNQGVAHAYSISPDDPAPYRELTEGLGVGHVMSIAQFDTILGIAVGLVLCRSPRVAPFSEANRGLVEVAFPHLIAGWTHCQVAELTRADPHNSGPTLFSAASRGSAFSAAEPEFLSLLRQEWPTWVGPYLPNPLIDANTGAAKARYIGERIVVEAKLAVDTALVTARQRSVVDHLTVRERTVAELCAQGMTYKEISAALNLAPATARNHIAAVHKRLGVARNGEIARLLATVGALP